MTINLIGNAAPVRRLITGLHSFDRAFENKDGDIGMPLGKGWELFGANHVGKSTVVYGLAGMVAHSEENGIVLADFEGFDQDFFKVVLSSAGFSGDVQDIHEEEDEEALDLLVSYLKEGEYSVGILDSIGAISPIAEAQGDLGAVPMGRRAFLMAQLARKCLKLVRRPKGDKNIFMVNHAYPKMGGRGKTTPGGQVKNYLATVRIELKRVYLKGKYLEFPDGSYVVQGKVVKNRWGFKNREFKLFVLAGTGIHLGMTALWDGIDLGVVKMKTMRSVKIGDVSYGAMRKIIQEAHDKNDDFFEPFFLALGGLSTSDENEEISENEGE